MTFRTLTAILGAAVVLALAACGGGAVDSTETAASPAATETANEGAVIHVENGEPVGGVQRLEVKVGDRVRFTVEADAPEEVHVHGYDISADVGPAQKAQFDFTADLEGIFEAELENSNVQILELVVAP